MFCFGTTTEKEATPLLEPVHDSNSNLVEQESRELNHHHPNLLLPPAASETTTTTTTTTKKKKKDEIILFEIVGAVGLQHSIDTTNKNKNSSNNNISTFCTVSVMKNGDNNNNNNKAVIVHKTSVINNDTSPIWTVASKSLCLLENLQQQEEENGTTTTITVDLKKSRTALTPQLIGSVTLSYHDLIVGNGERMEYPMAIVRPDDDNDEETNTTNKKKKKALVPTLALRFQIATQNDLNYFQNSSKSSMTTLTDTTTTNTTNTTSSPVKTTMMMMKKKKPVVVDSPTSSLFEGGSDEKKNNNKKKKEKKIRVQPGPDPDHPEETKFMTKQEINDTALLPSTHWTEVGSFLHNTNNCNCAAAGSLFIEILGCHNLPNMDVQLLGEGLTDAFCAMVLEDSYVKTPIIYNSLSPKWMPWSGRAFKFNIQHATSILFLGVLDYDELTIQPHDPIAKIEIHPCDFETDTIYHLTYPLKYNVDNSTTTTTNETNHKDENEINTTTTNHATIQLRLKVHWNDTNHDDFQKTNNNTKEKTKTKTKKPQFFVNCTTEKEWKVIRFLTRGPMDPQEVSLSVFKMYIKEVLEHWKQYCLFLDIMMEIFLWRGRLSIPTTTTTWLFHNNKKKETKETYYYSIWFPMHSMVLFAFLTLGMEYPELLPAILPATLAYALLCNNHYWSTHPSPWYRIRSFRQRFLTTTKLLPKKKKKNGNTTRNHHYSSSSSDDDDDVATTTTTTTMMMIAPGTGSDETRKMIQLDEYRANRTMGFLYECCMIGLDIYKVYNKSLPMDISTTDQHENLLTSFYSDYLSYAITIVRTMICKPCRLIRNFVNWKSQSTYPVTVSLLVFSMVWIFFPFKSQVYVALQVWVILLVGPHWKLLDMFWIQKYYRTQEELLLWMRPDDDGTTKIPEQEDDMKQDIASRPNILDSLSLFESSWVRNMVQSGRIVAETSLQLKAFRKEAFGNYSEHVHDRPNVVPSIPLVESSYATRTTTTTTTTKKKKKQPYYYYSRCTDDDDDSTTTTKRSSSSSSLYDYQELPPEKLTWSYIPGQMLNGTMVPQPVGVVPAVDAAVSKEEEEKKKNQ